MNKIFTFLLSMAVLSIALPAHAWGTLADVDNVKWSCPGGLLKVEFSFNMPAKDANGETSYAGQSMTWKIIVSKKTVVAGTATAGAKVETSYVFPEDNRYWATIQVEAADGKTSKREVPVFAGAGRPAAPGNVVLGIDAGGKATLTWDTPTSTIDNGSYVDYDSIYYDITRMPAGVKVASDLKANTFTEQLPLDDYAQIYYRVLPRFRNRVSIYAGQSNKVGYGKVVQVPFFEDFATSAAFYTWTNIDGQGDNRNWYYSEGGAKLTHSYNNVAGNDYLISVPIYLEKGKIYQFGMKDRQVNSASSLSLLDVLLAQSADTTQIKAKHQKLLTVQVTGLNYKQETKNFSVERTGNYYLVFHDVTPYYKGMGYLMCIDSISVDCMSGENAPGAVTQLQLTRAGHGGLRVGIGFTAPAVTAAGQPLSTLGRIDIVRSDSTLVGSVANPAIGATCSIVDNSPANGFNHYTVYAYNEAGRGLPDTATVYVGIDVPCPPTNVHLQDHFDGSATLTWSAPDTIGIHGGYVDRAGLKYDIYRLSEDTAVVKDWTDTTLEILSGIPTAGTQQLLAFKVVAKNTLGQSAKTVSNYIRTGAMYTLPFVDSYADASHVRSCVGNGMLGKTNNWGYIRKFSADGDGAAIGWLPLAAGDESTLYSGKISLEGATHPVLSYYYLNLAPVDQHFFVQIDRSSTDVENVDTVDYNKLQDMPFTWTRHGIDVADLLKNQKYVEVRYMCHANTTDTPGFAFDRLEVFDALDYDLAVEKIHTSPKWTFGRPTPVEVTVTNFGYKHNSKYTVDLYVGGKKVDSQRGVDLNIFESKVFTFHYTPLLTDTTTQVQAIVDYAYDANEDNNKSRILDMTIEKSPYNPIASLRVTSNAGGATLSWEVPDASTTPYATDDFETYAPWSTASCGKWTFYDGTGKPTVPATTYYYPHRGEPWAWMLGNDDEFVSSLGTDTIIHPRSGRQAMMSYSLSNDYKGTPNDSWLISPLLSGNEQVISAHIKNHGGKYSTHTVQVLLSSKSNKIEDFVDDGSIVDSGSDWLRIYDTIPAGTRYVAIRNISDHKGFLYLDDATMQWGTGAVKGFYIYAGGVLCDSVMNADCRSYSYQGAARDFQVAAIYDEGIASPSGVATAPLYGDVNQDGEVNTSDVTALIGMITGTAPLDLGRGDLNGDHTCNVSDVTTLIAYILSLKQEAAGN